MSGLEQFADGIFFGEGPRWHDGRLWLSDFFAHSVLSFGPDGDRRVEARVPGQPSGLGWLPDGRLLAVSMLDRKVVRREHDGTVVDHADLSGIATFHCNDMCVDDQGRAWVGNFGFDLYGLMRGEPVAPAPATLARVDPDGTAVPAAEGLLFPNGTVVDGDTLIVAESAAGRLTAFTVDGSGRLTDRRVWAQVDGLAPDGTALDPSGAVWVADAADGANRCVLLAQGGRILEQVETPATCFACALGGGHLWCVVGESADPQRASAAPTGSVWRIPR